MSNSTETPKKRIDWIDCVKGIGILSVILSHTIHFYDTKFDQLIRYIIFSYNMPLFFIVSGLTFRFSQDKEQFIERLKKSFKFLIIPTLIVYILSILDIFIGCQNYSHLLNYLQCFAESSLKDGIDIALTSYPYTLIYLKTSFKAIFYVSNCDLKIFDTVIPGLGPCWFLVVLFFDRALFDLLNLKCKINPRNIFILICILTLAGVIIGKIYKLPLALDLTFSVLIFLWLGQYFSKKKITESTNSRLITSLAIWLITISILLLTNSYTLNLPFRVYPLFPLCYVTAVTGTLFISYLSQYLVKFHRLASPLVYLGKYSLYLLCIHCLDHIYEPIWHLTDMTLLNGVIRIIIDSAILVLIVNYLIPKRDNKFN